MNPPHEAIRNLLGRYCELIDAADFVALGQMFTHAALLDDGGHPAATGAEAATGVWKALIRLYDGSPRTRHTGSSAIIEVDGDTATCRSTYVVFQEKTTGRLEAICAGRYKDTFGFIDGAWWFTSRQFFLDQIGDMSDHLVTE